MSKQHWVAACIGAVLAAILSAAGLAILSPLGEVRDTVQVLGSFVFLTPFCLVAEVFIGIPAFVAIVRLKLLRWWCWLPLAALLGFALDVAVGNPPASKEKLAEWMLASLVSAASFRFALTLPARLGMRERAA